jgi:RNA polymerase sigma factor for flagellar operon FliA
MKEVALALDITEGRVSQLHSQALGKLKKMFVREYGDIN